MTAHRWAWRRRPSATWVWEEYSPQAKPGSDSIASFRVPAVAYASQQSSITPPSSRSRRPMDAVT
ncbi:hypothetical protein [Corynebacterium kalidii]|uniref:hypothetical protein n=1 Tax=Corynebacterium kalidii TaxID=2931982 RepID=UPI003F6E9F45